MVLGENIFEKIYLKTYIPMSSWIKWDWSMERKRNSIERRIYSFNNLGIDQQDQKELRTLLGLKLNTACMLLDQTITTYWTKSVDIHV